MTGVMSLEWKELALSRHRHAVKRVVGTPMGSQVFDRLLHPRCAVGLSPEVQQLLRRFPNAFWSSGAAARYPAGAVGPQALAAGACQTARARCRDGRRS